MQRQKQILAIDDILRATAVSCRESDPDRRVVLRVMLLCLVRVVVASVSQRTGRPTAHLLSDRLVVLQGFWVPRAPTRAAAAPATGFPQPHL